jgi:hypothetical protein
VAEHLPIQFVIFYHEDPERIHTSELFPKVESFAVSGKEQGQSGISFLIFLSKIGFYGPQTPRIPFVVRSLGSAFPYLEG